MTHLTSGMIFLFILFYFNISLSFAGYMVRLMWVRRSSRKSSATHSCRCVQCFHVQKLVCCQCLGFLTCTQMLMHVTAHGGCTDIIREPALTADSERKVPCHTRDSNLHQSDALPTELSHPSTGLRKKTIQWPPKPHQVPKLSLLRHIGIYYIYLVPKL